MSTFYTLLGSGNNFHFRFVETERITLGINIGFIDENWVWSYVSWIGKDEKIPEKIILENGVFKFKYPKKGFSLNSHFYDFVERIKNHPTYRLKVIHLLDDEMRKVWNKV